MTHHWYRKGSSGVLTKVRMPSSAPERKPWSNNGQSQVSRMLDPNISIEAFLLPDYILQNAFSYITYLCPQRPDMAEKLKAKRPPFSRQCVSPTLLSNIGMKAFRKSFFLKDIKRYQNVRRQLFRKRVIAYIFVEIRRIHSQNSTKTTSFFTERHIAFIVTKSPFMPFNFEYGTYNSMIYSFYVIYLTGT